MLKYKYGILIVMTTLVVTAYAGRPGPRVVATKGEVWPKPQQQNTTDEYFIFRPRHFIFLISGSNHCNLLQNALERYWKILQENSSLKQPKFLQKQNKKRLKNEDFLGYIDEIHVNLTGACDNNEYPSIDMDESYKLWLTTKRKELQSSSIWGILRGLETFSQLVYMGDDGLTLRINSTVIKDFPRYKHRGLLIDTSRHFIPLDQIYRTLDALSYNKMNVLHWHIVDDESFPYVSEKFPELSQLGAYNPYTKVYSTEDVQDIIEYARVRGIRVLPEFDTPGHASSWGLSHPEILTPCETPGDFGPMDPSKKGTFAFLNELFAEIRKVFKDDFIHLGGDEVQYNCWKQDANITKFMKKLNITTYKGLESYYIQKIVNMVDTLKYSSIVWEDVFTNGVKLPNETIVHVWRSGWTETMKNVTTAGKYALLSSCWYLDYITSGGDWQDFYNCEPTDFNGTSVEQELVLGGEACMWGEVVNEYNIISRVWPRASATAEKLWSAYSEKDNLEDATRRLEEHTCRMNRRGIRAEPPNGPGYCD